MDDVVAVVSDLMSRSRISAVSRRTGRSVRYVTSLEAARGVDRPRLVLVDLDARVDIPAIIEALKRETTGQVVAFGPHLDADKLKAARAAGANRVLARSKFVANLPAILSPDGYVSEDLAAR